MRALITGASSGIGRDIAKELARRGYDIVIVARSEDKLNELKNEINNVQVESIPMDISSLDNCKELYNKVGYVEILVNNAGFGLFGKFNTTDIDREMEMVDLNVKSLHYLTKLFLTRAAILTFVDRYELEEIIEKIYEENNVSILDEYFAKLDELSYEYI